MSAVEAKAREVEAALFVHDAAGMSWAKAGVFIITSCGVKLPRGHLQVAARRIKVTCPRCLEKIGGAPDA